MSLIRRDSDWQKLECLLAHFHPMKMNHVSLDENIHDFFFFLTEWILIQELKLFLVKNLEGLESPFYFVIF